MAVRRKRVGVMATTGYVDTGFKVASVQARTDAAGAEVVDVDGEELRLYADILAPGVLRENDYQTVPGTGMQVVVGSGTAAHDIAVVGGTVAGQGNYMVRLDAATVEIAITAADLANPRIDQVFVVVEDDPYDSSARALPRIGVRTGDAAATPVAPGPDPAWTAWLLVATIQVPAGETVIVPGDIVDERDRTEFAVPIDPGDIGGTPWDDFQAHVTDTSNPHQVTASQTGAYPTDETYSQGEVDGLIATRAPLDHEHDADYAPVGHTHDAADIVSGVIAEARLPDASTTAQGVVKLNASVTSTSTTEAATPSAAKAATDKANTAQARADDAHSIATTARDQARYYPAGQTTGAFKITISDQPPSGGADGDIWMQYGTTAKRRRITPSDEG